MASTSHPKKWHHPSQDHWLQGRQAQAIQTLIAHLNTLGSTKPVDMLQQLAYYFYGQQDYRSAATITAQALAQCPDDPAILANMATCCSKAGQLEQAVEYARKAARLQADNALAWDVLAASLRRIGQLEEAREAGSTSLRIKDQAQPSATPGWQLPAGKPSELALQSGKQHVIAFSLWGKQPRYLLGLLQNALMAPVIYPGWELRCYLDDSVPADYVIALEQLGVDVRRQPAGQSLRERLCWRFQVANDPGVGYFLCRDADSVINPREEQAVREWLDSGRWFHTMRDWWSHTDLMLAGMWGGVAGVLPPLAPMLLAYHSGAVETANIDQWFLRDRVWCMVRQSCLIHDRCFSLHDSQPIPCLQPGQTDHVGMDMTAVMPGRQLRILAPWIRELACLAPLRPALQQVLQHAAG